MVAIGYKKMWQEANREIVRLQAKIGGLQRQHDELAAALMNRREQSGQIVDLTGIARHMRVDRRYTPQQWRQRGLLPPVDFPEIREPLWYASTIRERFAIPTGRTWYETPSDGEALSPAA